jgi:hypothetical protein
MGTRPEERDEAFKAAERSQYAMSRGNDLRTLRGVYDDWARAQFWEVCLRPRDRVRSRPQPPRTGHRCSARCDKRATLLARKHRWTSALRRIRTLGTNSVPVPKSDDIHRHIPTFVPSPVHDTRAVMSL